MPMEESNIHLIYIKDDHVGCVNKCSDAYVFASALVTIGLLFRLKGGRCHALYGWLRAR